MQGVNTFTSLPYIYAPLIPSNPSPPLFFFTLPITDLSSSLSVLIATKPIYLKKQKSSVTVFRLLNIIVM